MQKFVMFVIADSTELASPNERENIDAFNEKLQANNQWIYAAGICDHPQATLIDNRNDVGIIKSGSLFSSKEHYSGFWMIEVDSYETAQALAKEGSLACNRKVELRPLY